MKMDSQLKNIQEKRLFVGNLADVVCRNLLGLKRLKKLHLIMFHKKIFSQSMRPITTCFKCTLHFQAFLFDFLIYRTHMCTFDF